MITKKGVFAAIKEMRPVDTLNSNDEDYFDKLLTVPPKIGTKAYNMRTLEEYTWDGEEWILDEKKPKQGERDMVQLTETIRIDDLVYKITPEIKTEILRMLAPYENTAKLAPTPPVVVATTDDKPEGSGVGATVEHQPGKTGRTTATEVKPEKLKEKAGSKPKSKKE